MTSTAAARIPVPLPHSPARVGCKTFPPLAEQPSNTKGSHLCVLANKVLDAVARFARAEARRYSHSEKLALRCALAQSDGLYNRDSDGKRGHRSHLTNRRCEVWEARNRAGVWAGVWAQDRDLHISSCCAIQMKPVTAGGDTKLNPIAVPPTILDNVLAPDSGDLSNTPLTRNVSPGSFTLIHFPILPETIGLVVGTLPRSQPTAPDRLPGVPSAEEPVRRPLGHMNQKRFVSQPP
jgi:hypothetical protein